MGQPAMTAAFPPEVTPPLAKCPRGTFCYTRMGPSSSGRSGASGQGGDFALCFCWSVATPAPLRGLYSTEARGTEHFPASHLLSVLTSSSKHLLGVSDSLGHPFRSRKGDFVRFSPLLRRKGEFPLPVWLR